MRPRLEILEGRALRSGDVNIALNANPWESDDGWGGGWRKSELVDGLETYPTWDHGLAFTGGHTGGFDSGGWIAPAGPRQATINFGKPMTFDKVVLWHHGHDQIPAQSSLQYWNGSAWVNIAAARSVPAGEAGGAGSTADVYTFSYVTGSKVRYNFDNRGANIDGTPIVHGWLYEFEVFGHKAPDVVPSSLTWDTIHGGMNFSYTVSGGGLVSDVPVGLYWAKGNQWADAIAPISGFNFTIPAGTSEGSSPQQHVDGQILHNAPVGTTYLLVVTDPGNTFGTFDPAKNAVALADVAIGGGGNSHYPISSHTLETIKGLLREAGQGDQVAVITSTVRTPHKQAVDMFRNLELGRKQGDNTGRNYKPPGLAVIAVYDALRAKGITKQADIVAAMEAEIYRQGPYNVSHHCADAAQWAKLQVIDIDPSSITNYDLFHTVCTAAISDGRLSGFHDPEDDDPAFHLEISQV